MLRTPDKRLVVSFLSRILEAVDHLSNQSWTGEFFVPGDRENRFAGAIEYSPESGLLLSYRIVGPEIVHATSSLHGVTSSGDSCTLIGPFHRIQSETRFGGPMATSGGSVAFNALLLGDLVGEADTYTDASFLITNLDEFFYPTGYSQSVRLKNVPVCSSVTSFGEVTVSHSATLNNLLDIQAVIHCDNTDASEALDIAYQGVQALFPNALFMTRNELSCRIGLKMPRGCASDKILAFVHDISNLFALMTYRPAIAFDIRLRERDPDKADLRAYRSTYYERRTIESSQGDSFHWNMPIREPIVPLSDIIKNWIPIARDHSAIASTVQDGAGVRNENDIHAQIVLHATQLESISHGENGNKDKYEYPLLTYGGEHVCSKLMSLFDKEDMNGAARAITSLRGEIAHVGRPKFWLKRLSIVQIAAIEKCLQLTVIGHVLTKIGVPGDALREYQYRYLPGS